MHAIDLPRKYRTVIVVGSFGLGSDRQRDRDALIRLRDHVEPGGTLLIDIEVPYADPGYWDYWLKDKRISLPETEEPPHRRRRGSDGSEYAHVRTRVCRGAARSEGDNGDPGATVAG